MSQSDQHSAGGVSTAAWSFLVIGSLLLAVSLILNSQGPEWLDSLQLNPTQLRQLPTAFQAEDLWTDALPPVLLTAGAAIGSRWLPRRRWAYAAVEVGLVAITLRYFFWRFTTLNTAHPFTLGCSLLQLLMEVAGLLILLCQMLPAPDFNPRQSSQEASAGLAWTEQHQPSVAVWIPTYNESERIVERAVLTCQQLNYKHFSITVLDDGHRPSIAQLAERLGVHYLSRDGNAHRKAGNLNNALQHCQDEFIAVFDCDFIPSSNFLLRTLGFFRNERVAIVQTPQHYFQSDFHSVNLGLDQVMPGDLDYFYHFLQVRRDKANATICCGTSYVARREALLSIGGYFNRCIVEDYQTSTKLISNGWTVRYLNEVLSMGEVPRTLADFLDQRLRWMQGNIQIFFCRQDLPLLGHLNAQQLRWYLLPADLLSPLWRFTYLTMPLIGLILGFSVIAAPITEFMAYGVPFLIALYTLPNWLSNHYHHQFWMEVYESIFCFPALHRMAKVIQRPFGIYGGIVTNKDTTAQEQRLNIKLSWPLLTLLASMSVTILIRYLLPLTGLIQGASEGYEGESVVLSWNLYNALVLIVATLACIDQPVNAEADRFPIDRIGNLQVGHQQLWGRTSWISEDGARFDLQSPTPDGLDGNACEDIATLELMDPGIQLPVQLEALDRGQLLLKFQALPVATKAALLRLLYDTRHPFHAPRRLNTSAALLHWLGTLWRPRPLLKVRPAQPAARP